MLFFQVNKNFLWTVMLCERFRGCKHDPLPARSRVPCVQGEPLPGWVPITSPLLRLGCCPRSSPSGDVARCARHTASWHHSRVRTSALGPLRFLFTHLPLYLVRLRYLLCVKCYLIDFTNRDSKSSQLCDVDAVIIPHSMAEETERD